MAPRGDQEMVNAATIEVGVGKVRRPSDETASTLPSIVAQSSSIMAGSLPPAPWTAASAAGMGVPSFCLVDGDDADDSRAMMGYNPSHRRMRKSVCENRPELPTPTATELARRHDTIISKASSLLPVSAKSSTSSSALVHAVACSLKTIFAAMTDECVHLLAGLTHSDAQVDGGMQSVTPWLVLMAQRKALSYLDTLQRVLDEYPVGGDVDMVLAKLHNTLMVVRNGDEALLKDPGTLVLSPWTYPNLAMAVTLAGPLRCVREDSNEFSPTAIDVEVRGITEVCYSELQHNSENDLLHRVGSAACNLKIKKCERVPLSDIPMRGADVTGNVVVLATLTPIREGMPIRVLETRVHHMNAVPPRPVSTVDLFTSTEAGSLTVAVRFQTRKTINGGTEVPRLRIDLMVDSSPL